MSNSVRYEYALGDLLQDRRTYFYSPFQGPAFLEAWRAQRDGVRCGLEAKGSEGDQTPTGLLLEDLRTSLTAQGDIQGALDHLDHLLQRFEVTKRVHDAYDNNWRARDAEAYRTLELYISLAELLAEGHRKTGFLTYLNGLLKICDTLTSLGAQLSRDGRQRLRALLRDEAEFVDRVRCRVSPPRIDKSVPPLAQTSDNAPKFAMLACDSARSRAYIQAVTLAGLRPSEVILMSDDRAAKPGRMDGPGQWQNLRLPALGEPVSATCQRHNIPMTRVNDTTANSSAVQDAIRRIDAEVVVYSGFGGEIVSAKTLSSGPRFLHMHSGWVPEYRGSTTLYYALLNGECPGVSAIYLDPGIDTGPVVARRHYPTPPAGMDLDLVYDTAIRADLLCRVLLSYNSEDPMPQQGHTGCTYYVIHPVLKHISMLSLKPDENDR